LPRKLNQDLTSIYNHVYLSFKHWCSKCLLVHARFHDLFQIIMSWNLKHFFTNVKYWIIWLRFMRFFFFLISVEFSLFSDVTKLFTRLHSITILKTSTLIQLSWIISHLIIQYFT
jgi:hypothetical protein